MPPPGKRGAHVGRVMKENVVCKHSSAQRRADVAAVAWNVSFALGVGPVEEELMVWVCAAVGKLVGDWE